MLRDVGLSLSLGLLFSDGTSRGCRACYSVWAITARAWKVQPAGTEAIRGFGGFLL